LLRQASCKPRFDRVFLRGGALKTDRPNIKSGFAYPDLSDGISKVEVRIAGEDSSFFQCRSKKSKWNGKIGEGYDRNGGAIF
jgi:hypothetical protein